MGMNAPSIPGIYSGGGRRLFDPDTAIGQDFRRIILEAMAAAQRAQDALQQSENPGPLAGEMSDPTARKTALARIEAEKLRRGRGSLRQDLTATSASYGGSGLAIPR